MSKSNTFIGFPEGMIREKPIRLEVLANEPGWFVLQKISGLLGQVHPWYPNRPDITGAIRKQLMEKKRELERLKIAEVHYVWGPEAEISGPMLFAKEKETSIQLKNAYGSDQFSFTYWLVTEGKVSVAETDCSLPVAAHGSEPKALVSHKSGKKSHTRFRKIRESGTLSLWEAVSTLPRMHQIRLHALETGIPVVGDNLYAPESLIFVTAGARGAKRSAYRFSGVAIALVEVNFSKVLPDSLSISGKLSNEFDVFLRKHGLSGRE